MKVKELIELLRTKDREKEIGFADYFGDLIPLEEDEVRDSDFNNQSFVEILVPDLREDEINEEDHFGQ